MQEERRARKANLARKGYKKRKIKEIIAFRRVKKANLARKGYKKRKIKRIYSLREFTHKYGLDYTQIWNWLRKFIVNTEKI